MECAQPKFIERVQQMRDLNNYEMAQTLQLSVPSSLSRRTIFQRLPSRRMSKILEIPCHSRTCPMDMISVSRCGIWRRYTFSSKITTKGLATFIRRLDGASFRQRRPPMTTVLLGLDPLLRWITMVRRHSHPSRNGDPAGEREDGEIGEESLVAAALRLLISSSRTRTRSSRILDVHGRELDRSATGCWQLAGQLSGQGRRSTRH